MLYTISWPHWMFFFLIITLTCRSSICVRQSWFSRSSRYDSSSESAISLSDITSIPNCSRCRNRLASFSFPKLLPPLTPSAFLPKLLLLEKLSLEVHLVVPVLPPVDSPLSELRTSEDRLLVLEDSLCSCCCSRLKGTDMALSGRVWNSSGLGLCFLASGRSLWPSLL